MAEFIARLKQRKLVQWALAYIAFAFALIQVLDVVAQRFAWPDQIEKLLILALAIGFLVALVLACYHGERGAQKVSGTEIVILALLLAIGGGLLWRFARPASPVMVARMARSYNVAACRSGPCPRAAAEMQARSSANEGAGAPAAPIPAKSVAVLPFVNMSGDPKNDYFSDGITEEILDALAQLPNLKVAARTSAFAFKGKAEDLRKVGETLDVATVLEGSVQKAGDEVRITAQLIDTRSGYHLWSEKYDRKLTSIFAVEDEISKAIADKLRMQLTGGRPLVAQTQIDPRAHDLYLRGLALLAKRSLREAADTFHQAIAIDPGYAQAWGALAETEIHMPAYFLDAPATALPRAEAAAKRALAIDPNTASAWIALGMINHMRWRWADADTAFRRALQLAPGDAEVIDQYAMFLFSAGQFDAALREIDLAQALDPLAPVIGCVRINILYAMHRYSEAAAQARATIAAHPDFALARLLAMNVAIYQRHWRDAETLARKGAQLAGENHDDYALMVRGIADPAQRPAALRIVESAPADAHWELAPFTRIKWLALLGANDAALAAFDHAVTSGLGPGEQIIWDPALDSLRDDSRFKAVLKKMGLPETPQGTTAP